MGIEAIGSGEWDMDVPVENDPVLSRKREDIFIQLGLGLASLHGHAEADQLTTLLQTPHATDDEREYVVNRLRSIIRDNTKMPMLGLVIGEAYRLADIKQQRVVTSQIRKYLDHERVSLSPIYQGRRIPPAATEVA